MQFVLDMEEYRIDVLNVYIHDDYYVVSFTKQYVDKPLIQGYVSVKSDKPVCIQKIIDTINDEV